MFLTTRKTFKGFTLIELLIVIAIMGILAAAVLIAINPTKRQNQAKDATVKSDIASLGSAAQAYYTQKAYYPVDQNAIVQNGDLKVPLTPPTGAYLITTAPANCNNTTSLCTSWSVNLPLYDSTTGELWCWQSSTGKAQLVTAAAGCPAN